MARTNYKRHTDDDDDMRNILKDGERMRVPMYAMDGSMDHLDPLQRAVVRDSSRTPASPMAPVTAA